MSAQKISKLASIQMVAIINIKRILWRGYIFRCQLIIKQATLRTDSIGKLLPSLALTASGALNWFHYIYVEL